jgi:hypothetical protein
MISIKSIKGVIIHCRLQSNTTTADLGTKLLRATTCYYLLFANIFISGASSHCHHHCHHHWHQLVQVLVQVQVLVLVQVQVLVPGLGRRWSQNRCHRRCRRY